MKRLILALASLALIAGASADVANAKTRHSTNGWTQRNVALPSSQSGYHANGDLKYGPQIDYPQSPPGGGY